MLRIGIQSSRCAAAENQHPEQQESPERLLFGSLPSFALTPVFVNLCIKKFGSLPITTDSEFRESVYKENMQKVESPERLLFAHPHELGL